MTPLARVALWAGLVLAAQDPPAFRAGDGGGFAFDTGALRGELRAKGKGGGLAPVLDPATGASLAQPYGLLSAYRLLSAGARHLPDARDWPAEAAIEKDGSVRVRRASDDAHPFELVEVYRWSGPGTVDYSVTVRAAKALRRFEVFLASYFRGFPESAVYARGPGGPAFVPATREAGDWQVFPRDEEAVRIVQDGRWARPPHPVDWKVRPALAGALALRRDPGSGWTGLVMAPPSDCFAVLTPYGAEGHRSLYLSLLGRDLAAGETSSARARLVLGKDLTDARAAELYADYVRAAK
jgi:hypothetical protein